MNKFFLDEANSDNIGEEGEKATTTLNRPCFVENARDSGTDLNDSVLLTTKTIDADKCQTRCQLKEECNYFLYLTRNHPQWYKRRECRLLHRTGLLINNDNHVSGPKYCNISLTSDHKDSLETTVFNMTELSNSTTHQNLTQLVDDFLSLICKFQVFSGDRINV